MQREIKFRGKRVDGGGWVYGSLIIRPNNTCAITLQNTYDFHEVIPETVGQFTGVKDKNGIDIYEGDMDKSGNVIMWSERLCLFCLHHYISYFENWSEASYPICSDNIKVIGNITDNPQLLTK